MELVKTGRPRSAVNLTGELLKKIQEFKNIPGLALSLEQDSRPGRTAKIRVRLRIPKEGYIGKTEFSFDATPEGFKQATKKFKELKPSTGKVQTLQEIGVIANKTVQDYNDLKKTYTNDVAKWVNKNVTDEKYQTKGGVNKLFKDALKEFNKGKYIEAPTAGATGIDTRLKKILFIKDGKFQFPQNYEFLPGFDTKRGTFKNSSKMFKQLLAYQLLKKNPNFTNTMEDLTDFYTGKKTRKDFSQKELVRLQNFASDNNIGGSSVIGKILTQEGFDFNNKIYEFGKFKTVYSSLADELKQPGVADYRKKQIKAAMSRITRNSDTVLKQLKAEYPNLFKSQMMVLEHANPQAFTKTESFYPKNFRLKAQYAPSSFNALKNINFDQNFLRLSSRYNAETDPIFKNEIKNDIKKLVKKFNNETKVKGVGYLDDLDINLLKDPGLPKKIRVTDKAKLISDLTDQDTIQQVLKNTAHSNQYLKNYPDKTVPINPSGKGTYRVKDLQLEVPTLKEVSQNPNLKKFFNIFTEGTPKEQFKIAEALDCPLPGRADGGRIGYALGSRTVNCVQTKLATETEIPKLTQLDDSSPGLTKMKNAATGFLGFAKKGGKFGAIAAGGAAAAGLVKKFMNDDPTTYLSNEDQQKNMLIDMVTSPMVDQPDSTPAILDYQLPVLGATAAAGTAAVAPSTIEASRSARFGKKPSGITKTALKTLGRGLAASGTPLGLAALEPLHIAGQVQQGDSLGEIATNPWNYAGIAFADDLSKFATKGLGANAGKIMRLGISPAALRIGSRFLGMPGLALSLGISGYEMYDDYKKKRGWFSEE